MTESKVIRLTDSVYALCKAYPELVDFMASLGFTDIVKPGMLDTAGRFMTLPKGAKLKRIELDSIVSKLEAAGFTVLN